MWHLLQLICSLDSVKFYLPTYLPACLPACLPTLKTLIFRGTSIWKTRADNCYSNVYPLIRLQQTLKLNIKTIPSKSTEKYQLEQNSHKNMKQNLWSKNTKKIIPQVKNLKLSTCLFIHHTVLDKWTLRKI